MEHRGAGHAMASAELGELMINYRVDSLEGMLAQLKANGIEPVKGPDSDETGRFAWILDPDGNKVELWEPMSPGNKNKA